MNDRKFSRHLGKISEPHPLPLVQLGLEVGKLAAAPIMGGRSSPATFTGFGWQFRIDPPVGGFTNTDLVAQVPYTNGFDTLFAPLNPNTQLMFAPGHYMVQMNIQPPPVANLGYYVGFHEWDNDRLLLTGMGNGFAPFVGAISAASTVPAQGFFQFPLYAPKLWQARLSIFGTHADANIGNWSGVISPVHLLDDFASAS